MKFLLWQFGCDKKSLETKKSFCDKFIDDKGVSFKKKKIMTKKRVRIYQGSFDHVKVGPMPILELHNLWHQIHMFLDILEFRVEKKKNI